MATFTTIIKLLPLIISMIKQLLAAINAGLDKVHMEIDLSNFKKAEAKAEATKDTSDLENIFRGANDKK